MSNRKYPAQSSWPMSWNEQKNRPKSHRHGAKTINPSILRTHRRQVQNFQFSIFNATNRKTSTILVSIYIWNNSVHNSMVISDDAQNWTTFCSVFNELKCFQLIIGVSTKWAQNSALQIMGNDVWFSHFMHREQTISLTIIRMLSKEIVFIWKSIHLMSTTFFVVDRATAFLGYDFKCAVFLLFAVHHGTHSQASSEMWWQWNSIQKATLHREKRRTFSTAHNEAQ